MDKELLGELIVEAKRWSDRGVPDHEIDEAFQEATESFGSSLSVGFLQTIKRQIARWLLSFLKIDVDGFMALVIENAFANLEFKDYGKVFKDCDFTTTLLAETMIDTMADQFRIEKGYGGAAYTGLQAMVMDALGGTNAVQTVKDKMTDFICPKLSDAREFLVGKIPFLDKIV
jgi:hypothetical protein